MSESTDHTVPLTWWARFWQKWNNFGTASLALFTVSTLLHLGLGMAWPAALAFGAIAGALVFLEVWVIYDRDPLIIPRQLAGLLLQYWQFKKAGYGNMPSVFDRAAFVLLSLFDPLYLPGKAFYHDVKRLGFKKAASLRSRQFMAYSSAYGASTTKGLMAYYGFAFAIAEIFIEILSIEITGSFFALVIVPVIASFIAFGVGFAQLSQLQGTAKDLYSVPMDASERPTNWAGGTADKVSGQALLLVIGQGLGQTAAAWMLLMALNLGPVAAGVGAFMVGSLTAWFYGKRYLAKSTPVTADSSALGRGLGWFAAGAKAGLALLGCEKAAAAIFGINIFTGAAFASFPSLLVVAICFAITWSTFKVQASSIVSKAGAKFAAKGYGLPAFEPAKGDLSKAADLAFSNQEKTQPVAQSVNPNNGPPVGDDLTAAVT